jgi:hypothetical protein
MPEPLRTTIAQFSSSAGQWQPRAANVRAVEPAPDLPSAQRGSLYMLIEVSGKGAGQGTLYRQMLNAAQTAFYEMGDTVEVALRQAVRNAHSVLHRANEASPDAQWRGGMSLVVRYGDQLIIAQAGPSLILVSHPRTIDQFPAQIGKWGLPLGGPERPDVTLYDATVEATSMVLISQSGWTNQVAPEALAVAAAASNVALASQYLGQLAGKADLSALLISFTYDIPEVQEEPPATLAAGAAPASGDPASEAPRAAGRGLLAGRLFGRGQHVEETPSAETAPAAMPSEALPPPAIEVAPPTQPPRKPGHSPYTASAAPAEPAAEAAWDAPPASHPAAEPAAVAATVTEPAAEEEEPRSGRSPWWLLIALVVIPLLIAGIVLAMLFGRNNAVDTQIDDKLQGAANIITQAEAISDTTSAQQHLAGAADFLDQVAALRPDEPRLAAMRARYDNLMDRLQNVTPLYGIVPLWTFDQEGRNLQRVLVSGDAVFVLDLGRMEVDRFTRSSLGDSVTPADKPLIKKGEDIGGQTVADLIDMAWVETASAGQRSKLLVLDTAGGLVGYDVTWGPERLTLKGQDKWGQIKFAIGYGGNLYLVDVGKNQIWRYRPDGNGYSDPEPYFPAGAPVNMTGLVAAAIDGNVWLLYDDGRLLKYFGGEQRSFVWQDVPDTLKAPVAVSVPIEGDRLYTGDAGNGRIIETSKEGAFFRQFRAREGDILRGLRSMYLDEAGAMFYLLTPDGLYKADLPAAGEAPAATPTATASPAS